MLLSTVLASSLKLRGECLENEIELTEARLGPQPAGPQPASTLKSQYGALATTLETVFALTEHARARVEGGHARAIYCKARVESGGRRSGVRVVKESAENDIWPRMKSASSCNILFCYGSVNNGGSTSVLVNHDRVVDIYVESHAHAFCCVGVMR